MTQPKRPVPDDLMDALTAIGVELKDLQRDSIAETRTAIGAVASGFAAFRDTLAGIWAGVVSSSWEREARRRRIQEEILAVPMINEYAVRRGLVLQERAQRQIAEDEEIERLSMEIEAMISLVSETDEALAQLPADDDDDDADESDTASENEAAADAASDSDAGDDASSDGTGAGDGAGSDGSDGGDGDGGDGGGG